ncbi:MAG: hypothetical protein AABZ10_07325 [Nitrospirota bacterium]
MALRRDSSTGYSGTITRITDQQSSNLAEYGTTTRYGSSTTDSALTTSHNI